MRARLLAIATLVPVAIAGCGASRPTTHPSAIVTAATQSDGIQHVVIHATNHLRFSPAAIHVHTGRVEITLIDDGSYPHNFSIAALHATSKPVTGDPGEQSTTTRLTFNTPGTYQFVCTYHAQAGMRGTILVQP